MLRYLLAFIGSVFLISVAGAQTRVAIAETGCSVEVFCFPGRFDQYPMEDGSKVFADDCVKDGYTWGILCIELAHPINNLAAAQDSAISFLDFMKLDNGIVTAKGYERDKELPLQKNVRGVSDRWTDDAGEQWKVMAWTNGKLLVVLSVHGKKEVEARVVNVFLDSIRFPEK